MQNKLGTKHYWWILFSLNTHLSENLSAAWNDSASIISKKTTIISCLKQTSSWLFLKVDNIHNHVLKINKPDFTGKKIQLLRKDLNQCCITLQVKNKWDHCRDLQICSPNLFERSFQKSKCWSSGVIMLPYVQTTIQSNGFE